MLADEGNQLRRSSINYDPLENEKHLEDIRKVFTRELIQSHENTGYESPDPIFIVGLPRTGSTLVEQILASHSLVEGTAELPNLGAIANGTGKYRPDGLHYPETLSTLTQRDFASYGQEYLRQVARHRVLGTPFFIDKMPNNFIHVGWINLILPNAKIINTRRHPMDSLLGVYKQLFAKGQNFTYDTEELAEFYRSYVQIMNHWHEVLPGQVESHIGNYDEYLARCGDDHLDGGTGDDYFEVNHNIADIKLYGDNGDDTFLVKALLTTDEDGALLGTIGCTVWFHRAEVGFALGSAYWGQGYMPEALARVCDAAFGDPRIARVQALCDEENTRSARVMEKVGMRLEGRLRSYGHHPNRSAEPRDCLMYALVRGD